MKPKNTLINITLLLATVIVVCLVIEATIRIGDFFSSLKYQKKGFVTFYEYDPLLGWRHRKSIEGPYATSEYQIRLGFNSRGLRGPEYSYEKDRNGYRILILGDSISEGYTVNFEELFSEILKNRLRSRGIPAEVINAGVAGYSTDQELLFFKDEGKKYRPDLTVLMFCRNDIWYNAQPQYWRGYKPFFSIEQGILNLHNVPVPRPDPVPLTEAHGPERKTLVRRAQEWFLANSRLYKVVRDKIGNTGWFRRTGGQESEDPFPDEFKVWARKKDAKITAAWNVTEALIVELGKEASSIHSRLLVFYIPDGVNIYAQEWQDTKKKYNISDADWNIDQAGIELESFCKKNSIDFINPTGMFRARADRFGMEGRRLYYRKDGHWTPEGNKTAGEILADFIFLKYFS